MGSFSRRKGFVVVGSFLVAVASGCAPRMVDLRPEPLESQRVVYRDDRAATLSARTNRVAVALPGERVVMGTRVPFLVEVLNGSDAEFDFGPEDVTVEMDGSRLEVPVRSDLVAEARSRAASSRFLLGLGAALRSMGTASAATSETTGSISGVDSTGRMVTGTYSSTTVDHAQQAEEQRRDAAELRQGLQEVDRRFEETLQRYRNSYLARNTLAPGYGSGGEIYVMLPWCAKPVCTLTLTVRAGAEEHAFTFDVARP